MTYHATILKELTQIRGRAAYGYIDELTKDDFRKDALNFKDPVEKILEECERLIGEYSKNQLEGKDKNKKS